MSKRGRTSTISDDVHAPTPTLQPPKMETDISTSSLTLTQTILEISLEAHDLWEIFGRSEINRKKDRLALLLILNSISKSQSNQINIKKSVKQYWEVLLTFHVGMYKVAEAKVHALNREFETIFIKRNEKMDKYSNTFSLIFTNLRYLRESLDEYGIVSRLLRLVPK